MPADIRAKALGYLRSGAVQVLTASTVLHSNRPFLVHAHVRGHNSDYVVRLDGASAPWTCTCRQDGCAHRAAVQLVTGWPSAAALASKPVEEAAVPR